MTSRIGWILRKVNYSNIRGDSMPISVAEIQALENDSSHIHKISGVGTLYKTFAKGGPRFYLVKEEDEQTIVGKGSSGIVHKAYSVQKKDAQVSKKPDYVVKITDVYDDDDKKGIKKESEDQLPYLKTAQPVIHEGKSYLFMEYIPGESLYDFMYKGYTVDEQGNIDFSNTKLAKRGFQERIKLILKSCLSLSSIHHPKPGSPSLTHRDLKPANIFLDDKEEIGVVIGDFGLALKNETDDLNHLQHKETHAASILYQPLDAIYGDFGPKTDIHSLSLISGQILSQNPEVPCKLKAGKKKEIGKSIADFTPPEYVAYAQVPYYFDEICTGLKDIPQLVPIRLVPTIQSFLNRMQSAGLESNIDIDEVTHFFQVVHNLCILEQKIIDLFKDRADKPTTYDQLRALYAEATARPETSRSDHQKNLITLIDQQTQYCAKLILLEEGLWYEKIGTRKVNDLIAVGNTEEPCYVLSCSMDKYYRPLEPLEKITPKAKTKTKAEEEKEIAALRKQAEKEKETISLQDLIIPNGGNEAYIRDTSNGKNRLFYVNKKENICTLLLDPAAPNVKGEKLEQINYDNDFTAYCLARLGEFDSLFRDKQNKSLTGEDLTYIQKITKHVRAQKEQTVTYEAHMTFEQFNQASDEFEMSGWDIEAGKEFSKAVVQAYNKGAPKFAVQTPVDDGKGPGSSAAALKPKDQKQPSVAQLTSNIPSQSVSEGIVEAVQVLKNDIASARKPFSFLSDQATIESIKDRIKNEVDQTEEIRRTLAFLKQLVNNQLPANPSPELIAKVYLALEELKHDYKKARVAYRHGDKAKDPNALKEFKLQEFQVIAAQEMYDKLLDSQISSEFRTENEVVIARIAATSNRLKNESIEVLKAEIGSIVSPLKFSEAKEVSADQLAKISVVLQALKQQSQALKESTEPVEEADILSIESEIVKYQTLHDKLLKEKNSFLYEQAKEKVTQAVGSAIHTLLDQNPPQYQMDEAVIDKDGFRSFEWLSKIFSANCLNDYREAIEYLPSNWFHGLRNLAPRKFETMKSDLEKADLDPVVLDVLYCKVQAARELCQDSDPLKGHLSEVIRYLDKKRKTCLTLLEPALQPALSQQVDQPLEGDDLAESDVLQVEDSPQPAPAPQPPATPKPKMAFHEAYIALTKVFYNSKSFIPSLNEDEAVKQILHAPKYPTQLVQYFFLDQLNACPFWLPCDDRKDTMRFLELAGDNKSVAKSLGDWMNLVRNDTRKKFSEEIKTALDNNDQELLGLLRDKPFTSYLLASDIVDSLSVDQYATLLEFAPEATKQKLIPELFTSKKADIFLRLVPDRWLSPETLLKQKLRSEHEAPNTDYAMLKRMMEACPTKALFDQPYIAGLLKSAEGRNFVANLIFDNPTVDVLKTLFESNSLQVLISNTGAFIQTVENSGDTQKLTALKKNLDNFPEGGNANFVMRQVRDQVARTLAANPVLPPKPASGTSTTTHLLAVFGGTPTAKQEVPPPALSRADSRDTTASISVPPPPPRSDTPDSVTGLEDSTPRLPHLGLSGIIQPLQADPPPVPKQQPVMSGFGDPFAELSSPNL